MPATEPRDILIQAIFAKWDATPALVSACPGVWQGDRDTATTANPASGTHFPYAVLPDGRQYQSVRTGQTCGNDYWTHQVGIRLYHNSYAECAALVALVAAVFSTQSLTLTLAAGSLVKNKEGRVKYVKESEGVHYAELTYEFETSFPLRA